MRKVVNVLRCVVRVHLLKSLSAQVCVGWVTHDSAAKSSRQKWKIGKRGLIREKAAYLGHLIYAAFVHILLRLITVNAVLKSTRNSFGDSVLMGHFQFFIKDILKVGHK